MPRRVADPARNRRHKLTTAQDILATYLHVQDGGKTETIPVSGEFVLVPANVWHTARPARPTTMLFLTPGAGTEHRPV